MTEMQIDDTELTRGWVAAVRAVNSVQHSFAMEIEELGIPFAYFAVFTLLIEADQNRLPMSHIARDLSMTSGGFTKLADRMARDGLIDRRGSAGDRRVVFAALTDSGLELGLRAERTYRRILRQRVLGVLDAGQMRELTTIAEQLYAANVATELDPAPFQVNARPDDAPDRRSGRT